MSTVSSPPKSLQDFAFMPYFQDEGEKKGIRWVDQVAVEAATEDWGEKNRFLTAYCNTNFAIAMEQGLVSFYDDIAVWRIGKLLSKYQNPIYMIFEKNNRDGKQPYKYSRVVSREDKLPTVDGKQIAHPGEPTYDLPSYPQGGSLKIYWEHIFDDRESRVGDIFARENITNKSIIKTCIAGAIYEAHYRAGNFSFKQYYNGEYGWFIPLFITHDNLSGAPDLLATVNHNSEANLNIVKTVLLPRMGYAAARSVCANFGELSSFKAWLP